MTTVEKIAYYYKKGKYTLAHLQTFLEKGVITQEEYDNIVNQ